jgi:hypothetical protein
MEPSQRIWVLEKDQPVPGPGQSSRHFLDTHHPHWSLQTDADVRAWMAYMLHPSVIEGMQRIRFV